MTNKNKIMKKEEEDKTFVVFNFENASTEYKGKIIEGFIELSAKHAIQIYKSLGLQVGFEGTVKDEISGEEFTFYFKKKT